MDVRSLLTMMMHNNADANYLITDSVTVLYVSVYTCIVKKKFTRFACLEVIYFDWHNIKRTARLYKSLN